MIARNMQKVVIFFKRSDLVSFFSQLVFLLSLIRLEIFLPYIIIELRQRMLFSKETSTKPQEIFKIN